MKLKKCLEKISKNDFRTLLEYYGLRDEDDLKSNNINCLNDVILSYVKYLDDKDIKTMNDILSDKVVGKNAEKLLQKGLVFKISSKLVICDEVKTEIDAFSDKESRLHARALKLLFYVFANGAIKENYLLTLAKKIDSLDDPKELVEVVKNFEGIVSEDGLIFYNKYVKDGYKKDEEFQEAVNAPLKYYRIFSSDEMTELNNFYQKGFVDSIVRLFLESDSSYEKLEDVTNFAEEIFVGMMLDHSGVKMDKRLKKYHLKLANHSKKSLEEFLVSSAMILPNWFENGALIMDILSVDDSGFNLRNLSAMAMTVDYYDDDSFLDNMKEMDLDDDEEEDSDYGYIEGYLTINGVLRLDKLMELLKKSNASLTKSEVINYIEDNESLFLKDDYVSVLGNVDFAMKKLLTKKEEFGKYKIVDNSVELYFKLNEIMGNVELLLRQYKVSEEISHYITANLVMTGSAKKCLENCEDVDSFKMSDGVKKRFLSELTEIVEDLPAWIYNGYSEKEFKKLNKKAK